MQSKATTVAAYLAALPADRREAIEAVRAVIRKNLDKGYEEGMQYGMVGYFVPHRIYPPGYHCDPEQPLPFAGLASQKNYMSVYLMCTYGDGDYLKWFRDAWAKTGKKLDMGRCCIRFKKLDDLPLDLIGEAIRRVPTSDYIAYYESVLHPGGRSSAIGAAKRPAKKAAAANRKPAKPAAKNAAKKARKAARSRRAAR